jgi:hypothetical protein
VEQGNPPDAPQLVKKRAGRTPRIVTAARGYARPRSTGSSPTSVSRTW